MVSKKKSKKKQPLPVPVPAAAAPLAEDRVLPVREPRVTDAWRIRQDADATRTRAASYWSGKVYGLTGPADQPAPVEEAGGVSGPSGKDVPDTPPQTDLILLPNSDIDRGEAIRELTAASAAMDQFINSVKPMAAGLEQAGAFLRDLEKPADPVLENGLGQAMIHYTDPTTGLEKVKGYTRVTTYIDSLDDKTVLTKWKMRTLLEGGALEYAQQDGESASLHTVSRSMSRTDAILADIVERERVDGELLGLRRAEVLKEHRDLVERVAEDLMEIGGAHDKANKGTNLHRLTELVDNGQPLPADVSASDRRDVEAYQAKIAELDLRVLWCERRVVLDDIQVSGTMDRAYQVLIPGMKRRIRVVGDIKTGSVDFGRGKIGCQLALYARGMGYDYTKPLDRERLSLSRVYGLLVHLPQGEGRCDVYVVDLELAARGLELARQVREWRRDQRRVYDLKKPMVRA